VEPVAVPQARADVSETASSEPPVAFFSGNYDNENGYAAPGYGFDSATTEAVSPDGRRAFVTGVSWAGPGAMDHDWVTVAFDHEGRSRWMQREKGGFEGMDAPADVATTPDGKLVLVTGTVDFRTTRGYASDIRTVAYRTDTGARVWTTAFDGPVEGDGLDVATGLSISPDGRFAYVIGESATDVAENNIRTFSTVAYDVETGTEIWRANLQQNGTDYRPLNVATSPDGRFVYVSGKTGLSSMTTIAYRGGSVSEGAGSVAWRRDESSISREGGVDRAIGGDMEVSPTGATVFVLGTVTAADFTKGFATVAYDAVTGNRKYVAEYRPASPYTSAQARVLAVSPDGATVYALGHSLNPGAPVVAAEDDWDFTAIAYEAATGQQRWISQTNVTGTDTLFDAAVIPGKDQLVLTGRTGLIEYSAWGFDSQPAYVRAGSGERAATIGLDVTTGSASWIDTYDGFVTDADWPDYEAGAVPNSETIWRGTAIVPSPDGARAYVMGSFSRNNEADSMKWLSGYTSGVHARPQGNTMNYSLFVYSFV
jgi:hypothetical protein